MNGQKSHIKIVTGSTTASATDSARESVSVFGTISPNTTWSAEMIANARITLITTTAPSPSMPMLPKSSSNTRDTAGSPTAPSASEESVIATWKAEIKRAGSSSNRRTRFADFDPSSTSSSMRVRRTATKAYSADTKKAFHAMITKIRTISINVTDDKSSPQALTEALSPVCWLSGWRRCPRMREAYQ